MSDMTLLRDVRRRKRTRKPMTKRQRRRLASLLIRRRRTEAAINKLFAKCVGHPGDCVYPLTTRLHRIDGEIANLHKSIAAN